MTVVGGLGPDVNVDDLSEQAVELCVGWFSRGEKVTVNISPPHANLHANRVGLDELVSRGYVLHEHNPVSDVHTYRGTSSTAQIKASPRGRATMMRLLGVSE